MSSDSIVNRSRGELAVPVPERKGRTVDFEGKYLSTADQTTPLYVIIGRDKVSTTSLLPLTNVISTGDGGGSKKSGGGTKTYYAQILYAICAGVVDKIYAVNESDNSIWDAGGTGQSIGNDSTASTNNITTYGYGNLRIWNGAIDYTVTTLNPYLPEDIQTLNIYKQYDSGSEIEATMDNTLYRGIAMIYSAKWKLGDVTNNPNILAEVECGSKEWSKDYPDEWVSTWQNSNGDIVPPMIVYECLRNTFWSRCSVGKDEIDKASFVESANRAAEEGIYITATFDANKSGDELISQILQYCDGVLYVNAEGKLACKLPRYYKFTANSGDSWTAERVDSVGNIGAENLLDEPSLSVSEKSWGITKISFNDRFNDYEETSEVIEHPDYVGIDGEDVVSNELDLPYIKTRAVAKKVIKRLACAGVAAQLSVILNVSADWCRTVSFYDANGDVDGEARQIHVGDLLKLTYSKLKLSGLIIRVNRIGVLSDGTVELECSSEPTNWKYLANDYLRVYVEDEKSLNMRSQNGYLRPMCLQYNNNIFTFCAQSERAGKADYSRRWNTDSERPGYIDMSWESAPEDYQIQATMNRWYANQDNMLSDGVYLNYNFEVELDGDDYTELQKGLKAGEVYGVAFGIFTEAATGDNQCADALPGRAPKWENTYTVVEIPGYDEWTDTAMRNRWLHQGLGGVIFRLNGITTHDNKTVLCCRFSSLDPNGAGSDSSVSGSQLVQKALSSTCYIFKRSDYFSESWEILSNGLGVLTGAAYNQRVIQLSVRDSSGNAETNPGTYVFALMEYPSGTETATKLIGLSRYQHGGTVDSQKWELGWGNGVTISAATESDLVINQDTVNGIYYYTVFNERVELIQSDNSGVESVEYRNIYSRTYSSSATIDHTIGADGRITIIASDNSIILTLPSLDKCREGDRLQFSIINSGSATYCTATITDGTTNTVFGNGQTLTAQVIRVNNVLQWAFFRNFLVINN